MAFLGRLRKNIRRICDDMAALTGTDYRIGDQGKDPSPLTLAEVADRLHSAALFTDDTMTTQLAEELETLAGCCFKLADKISFDDPMCTIGHDMRNVSALIGEMTDCEPIRMADIIPAGFEDDR